eukprot:1888325-Rhodomonas_salina.1
MSRAGRGSDDHGEGAKNGIDEAVYEEQNDRGTESIGEREHWEEEKALANGDAWSAVTHSILRGRKRENARESDASKRLSLAANQFMVTVGERIRQLSPPTHQKSELHSALRDVYQSKLNEILESRLGELSVDECAQSREYEDPQAETARTHLSQSRVREKRSTSPKNYPSLCPDSSAIPEQKSSQPKSKQALLEVSKQQASFTTPRHDTSSSERVPTLQTRVGQNETINSAERVSQILRYLRDTQSKLRTDIHEEEAHDPTTHDLSEVTPASEEPHFLSPRADQPDDLPSRRSDKKSWSTGKPFHSTDSDSQLQAEQVRHSVSPVPEAGSPLAPKARETAPTFASVSYRASPPPLRPSATSPTPTRSNTLHSGVRPSEGPWGRQ